MLNNFYSEQKRLEKAKKKAQMMEEKKKKQEERLKEQNEKKKQAGQKIVDEDPTDPTVRPSNFFMFISLFIWPDLFFVWDFILPKC
jgi:hypothetical protein